MISRRDGAFHEERRERRMGAEVPVPRWTAALALALCLPAAAWAQAPPSPELCRALARAWSLPAAEVEALALESGADLQELAVAAMVAKGAGKPIGEVWAIHAASPTWADAFAKAGLDPSGVVASVEGRLGPATWGAVLDKGEPVCVAALVRTLERLTGRAPEPLARELARRAFVVYFAELAGVSGTAAPPAASQSGGPSPSQGLELSPVDKRDKLVMPYPGYQPALSGSKAPPATTATSR